MMYNTRLRIVVFCLYKVMLKKKKYGAHSHVRATARLEEHIIHSRGQRYVVPLALPKKNKTKPRCL